ncbi:hypothetical protein [Noviherbaspirillum saxi]|uniref:Uncharacterized protein n=1 Tax=Noviherbaspirillum saxi TaxID=2320863 RepID=A0A3A3FIS1_9BURK|nr:hypothetical protein [Noviherbaspirillum saxi]RJF95154.1 hypothetical protein D3871_16990 [Noviherbaspirillum saxi]
MSNEAMRADYAIAPPKKLPWYRKLGMQVLLSLILGIAVELEDGNLLPEDMSDANLHPAGIQLR